jgi:nucleoside diphosphate kinase
MKVVQVIDSTATIMKSKADSLDGCSLVIVKPWCLSLADEILGEFDKVARRVATVRLRALPEEMIRKHYMHHSDKSYFEPMVSDLAGKPAILAVYKGRMEAINQTKGVVRETYAHFVPSSDLYRRDAIHASINGEEFSHEFLVWKDYLFGRVK